MWKPGDRRPRQGGTRAQSLTRTALTLPLHLDSCSMYSRRPTLQREGPPGGPPGPTGIHEVSGRPKRAAERRRRRQWREELAEGRLQDEDSAPLPRGGTAQALAGLAARPPHEGVLLVGAGARRQRPEQRAARGRHDDDREGLGRGPAHGPGLVPEARQ
ncbi:unnamed protein product, partial [Prorocentrum cordatum]